MSGVFFWWDSGGVKDHNDHNEHDSRRPEERLVTYCDLLKTERYIMSAISEFAARQAAFNVRQDAAIAGLVSDVQILKDEIARLNANPGPISTEDQALLDSIEAQSLVIVAKLEALDKLTPPLTTTP